MDPTRRFQPLLGFGGAFTEAAALTWQQLAPGPADESKATGTMNHGGQLGPECRTAWAQCCDSCTYSAEEGRDFVRDHLGPALHAAPTRC